MHNVVNTVGIPYEQANLVIVEEKYALDFVKFCVRNPKSCPLIEVCDTGVYVPSPFLGQIDLRYDLAFYRIYKDGELLDEVSDLRSIWKDNFVSFLIGCSYSFDVVLAMEGVLLRHMEMKRNVSMYNSNIPSISAGIFSGNMVVSMRFIQEMQLDQVIEVSSRYPQYHGSPVHVGDPGDIGISDLSKPDYGDSIERCEGDIPVFWGCGVTPQNVALQSKIPFMITHRPGSMLVTSRKLY